MAHRILIIDTLLTCMWIFILCNCGFRPQSDPALHPEPSVQLPAPVTAKEERAKPKFTANTEFKAPTKVTTLSPDSSLPKTGDPYKNGSQGALKPALTGNSDDDDDENQPPGNVDKIGSDEPRAPLLPMPEKDVGKSALPEN